MRVRVEGLDRLRRKMEKYPEGAREGLRAGAAHLMSRVKVYPPSTIANKPKQWKSGGDNSWYQRGWGSKWVVKSGEVHGYKTSEKLDTRWDLRVEALRATIVNNASYAPFVHDTERQAEHMRRIGWKTANDILKTDEGIILELIKAHLEK